MRRLKLILRTYGGPRRLCLGRWMSEEFSLGTSIVAGCAFATTLLKVMLLTAMDLLMSSWRTVRAYLVVDDVTLAVYGRLKDVEFTIFGATRWLCDRLEADGFKISLTKGVLVSSDLEAGKRTAWRLRKGDFRLRREAKNLGVDFRLDGKASLDVLRGRLGRLSVKASR